jgi:gliding motility-associated-like protein
MKMRLIPKLGFLIVFLFLGIINNAQLITTTTTSTVDQVIRQSIQCAQISNVTSNINGSIDGLNSFGSFTQGASSFPFSSGFFLTTGSGDRIGNNAVNTDLSDGTTLWGGDSDLEAFTGITNTVNATVIEFDFISNSNSISFNYILASEEYQQNFPCNAGDKFVLLIKPQGGIYENIAVLPGTNNQVGISTIHPGVLGECAAVNPTFFAGQNLGATNFDGRTVPLTATASVIPNTSYHIKMVIADQASLDPTGYDSAIFIESGNLQTPVDLGPDIVACRDVLLDADIGNNLATYRWFRDTTELMGQTNSTLLANFTGSYRVEITTATAGTGCTIEDTINVTIDPNQLNFTIPDEIACDDDSGDGFEIFNLSDISNDVINQLSASNYSTNFYLSAIDAQNGINELANNYSNITNPQTVYLRVIDLNTGCQGIQPVNLIVSSNQAIDYSFTICDENADGIISIDLSIFDNEVSLNNNSTVSYYLTQNDATNNTAALTNPFFASTTTTNIYARVFNPIGNCFDISTVDINILLPPSLNFSSFDMNACDIDLDGFATFDITSIIPNFTSNASGINISYHTTQLDADNNANPIINPGAFDNTTPRLQRVFIRFESVANGCTTIAPVNLYTNRLLSLSNVTDQGVCGEPNNVNFGGFDLALIANEIIDGQFNGSIEFFVSETDRLADTNQIDTTIIYNNISNPQTLYIRINGGLCTEFEQFDLIVLPPVQSQPIPPQTYCDEDQDLNTTIPLSLFNAAVRGSFGNNFNVLYYLTQNDAIAGTNPVTSVRNTTNPIIVYGALINPSGCSDFQPMQITVQPAPIAGSPNGFVICDVDQDGFFIVDLTSQESQISTDLNRIITYHNRLVDARNGTNQITNPSAYNAQTETVYVRLENSQTGCRTIETLPIIVNTIPLIPSISEYLICETDGDFIEDFFFSTKDTEILNGQAGKTVRYYNSLVDANARVNEIDKFNAYRNTSSPQTIWVRVENNTDTSCFAVGSFNLRVEASTAYSQPQDYVECDDNNDGIFTFDLQPTLDQIRQGISNNLLITLHESSTDAATGLNPLPLSFTNTVNPQMIYARIVNEVDCFEVEEIQLAVINRPEANDIPPFAVCDTDQDGVYSFDLTSSLPNIVGTRPFNSIFSWHTSFNDAEVDANPIINETAFTNTTNPQTVYLRYYNELTTCYDVGTLELIVNLDPVISQVNDFIVCENTDQLVDLTEVIPRFLGTLPATGLTISFYSNDIDAENATNPVNTSYNYTANFTQLFIRVENTTTGCYSTNSFNLVIQPLPQIAPVGSYDVLLCDDDFDRTINYDLLLNNNAILNGLNPATHIVQYYFTQVDALNETNEIINTDVLVNQSENFFVRVTNTAVGCVDIGTFEVFTGPFPFLTIDTQVICNNDSFVNVNAATGAPGETYLWSTGETTSSINITTAGDYSVVVTNQDGCNSPRARFTVIESETANIQFVASTNFGDPNTITVTVNGTGDYRYVLDNGTAQRSNIFTNVSRGYHEVQVIDVNGCAPTAIQRVLIVDYPRFFTPNNDGFNDTWSIDDIESFEKVTIHIFDRYGKLLKTYGKDSGGWDGTFNGNLLPSSDYWFSLEIIDLRGDYTVKGHFSLKR